MPVTRTYRCRQCGYQQDESEAWDDTGPSSVCPACRAPSYRRVLQLPQFLTRATAPAHRDVTDARFRREFVGREADGSETVYATEQQAFRGEVDRLSALPLTARERERVAERNLRHMRQYQGLRPGTVAAAKAAAIEERVG